MSADSKCWRQSAIEEQSALRIWRLNSVSAEGRSSATFSYSHVLTQLASWLWDKVSGWISSIWDGICDFFGIHSPSKEMAWVGEMLVKGLAGSIDDNGDEAVKAAEGMAEDINGVMGDLAHDMQTALPTDFDVNGSIRSAVDGVVGKAASAFTIALNITNFNNYSSEDIRQLTSEVMETANQFAQRKGVVFA